MRYTSTRGGQSGLTFTRALMTGLAADGGLLLPERIPAAGHLLDAWQHLDYTSLAEEIFALYIDDIPREALRDITARATATFDHEEITPLVQEGNLYFLELFHGPTLAFKDVALQLLGNLFEWVLKEEGGTLNVLGATSGDTGSAAIEGLRGRAGINVFIMYPEGRTSLLQERQMTTVLDDNVFNLCVKGSFDDCQQLLKGVFNHREFRERMHLGAVNSVNWARIMAQIVYYFSAWFQLQRQQPGAASFDVCVPTGNFGNVFAGYLARRMGLPIERLTVATNCNDILARFFNTGHYQRGEVRISHSPAMDIQVASNFERYLYYLQGENPEKVVEFMQAFSAKGAGRLPYNTKRVDDAFCAGSASDLETLAAIRDRYSQSNYLLCPHTAVAAHVAQKFRRDEVPMVCLATAHPAKFSEAMQEAVPDISLAHPSLANLLDLPERKTGIQPLQSELETFIEQAVSGRETP